MELTSRTTGFTLVELLITIGIIGILATVTVISVQNAQVKARDAKRLSEIKSLGTALDIYATDFPGLDLGCNSGDFVKDCTALQDPSAGVAINFSAYRDPAGTVACTNGVGKPCQYTIRSKNPALPKPKTDDYEICFYLQGKTPLGDAGPYALFPGGQYGKCSI